MSLPNCLAETLRMLLMMYLAELGLIELEKGKSNGREKTMPVVKYDKILLEIPV